MNEIKKNRSSFFPKTYIIGVSGKMGSGKDTFSEFSAEFSNIPVERHAFADRLRDITEMLVGHKMAITHEVGKPFANAVYNYTQDDKNVFLPLWNKTVGQCLQQIGTDSLRNHFDDEVWVKALFATKGKECLEKGHILIIPDVRFPNEADAILERGGIVIRLEGDPLDVRKNSKRDINHISETALDNYSKFTRIIKNDVFGLENFRPKVEAAFKELVLWQE